MDASALKEAFDTVVLWGCCLGLGGVALAALALGLSRCSARVRAAVRRLGWPTVFLLGGFMAYATMEGSVTRTYKERCAEAASGFLDGIDKIDRIAETDTPNASNPVNPVKDPPRLPASNNSALSDSNLTLSSVTNPCFYGIEKGTDTVTLGVAWPDAHSLPNGRLDVFGHWQLTSGGWTRLAQVDVSGAQPPAAVEIDVGSFPTDAMERAAFFRLATQDDSDGDGLSDAYEAWTLGTGPANHDTDGDGLGDGDEVALGTDPLGADTDGDGVVDGAETGCVVKADGFEWYDTTGWATVYGTSYGDGLHSYWGALAVASLPDGLTVLGSLMSKAVCFDNGVMYLNAPGSNVALVFPELATPLDRGTYSMGDILVAPYWCSTALVDGDASSCMRTGIVESNGCFVVEYRNVRLRGTSDDRRMTYQVIVPGGTGSVVRVSYLASDVWLDGSDAVVGVQVRRIVTPDGLYNLTWDFAERGPILPGTTVEYRLGHGSDPLRADTDGDGLDDGAEVALGTLPTSADTDGDGLDDDVEIGLGTNPLSADSDGDGLRDDWEVAHGLDPLVSAGDDGAGADPDGDGLTNLQEQQWGTGPLNADTDGDGLSDRQEVNVYGTSPINADTDGDGLNDGAEIRHGADPFRADTDCDGLPDGLEVALGTDPCQPDTDGDGMDDGWEHENGFDPTVDNATDDDLANDADADPDGDGLMNADECAYGTGPHKKDTDGDGVADGAEIAQCSDPSDASDEGKPNSRVRTSLCFGDHSGSHSEKYRLTVTPVEGRGERPSSFAWINADYGACETRTAFLKPGWRYEARLAHAGTKSGVETDYDYTLTQTGDLPPNVVLVDDDSLFGVDDTSTAFAGEGKVANLYVLDFTVVSDKLRSYDNSEEGQLIDSRTATVTVCPSLAGLDGHAVSFEAMPVETGALVNDGHGTEITFTRSGASVWKTSEVYWYGVLPDRDCHVYHHPYAITLKVDGQEALTRKLSVYWPETNAHATFFGPLTNATRPGAAKHYNATSGGFWYCSIVFEEFDKSLGLITSEPSEPGEFFTWSGQYADKILEEEEFHMKQFRGEVPLEQGGQGDCYTVKGLKYFIAQQAKTNVNIATSTWIVKGDTAEKAEENCRQVIQAAMEKEMAVSKQIMDSDKGFRELKAKEHVGYNAGLRYHCTYLQKYGASPKNHTHPAYLNNE